MFTTNPGVATLLEVSELKGDGLMKWGANSGTIDLTQLRYRYVFLNPDAVLTNSDRSSSLGETRPRYEILIGDKFETRFFMKGMEINVGVADHPEASKVPLEEHILYWRFPAFGYNMFDFSVEFMHMLESSQIEEIIKAEIIKAWTEVLSGAAVTRAFDDLFERVHSNDNCLEILAIKEIFADPGTRLKEALGAAFHRKFPNSYPCKQDNPRSERAIKNTGRTPVILQKNLLAALSIALPPLEGDVAAEILSLFQRAPVYSGWHDLPKGGAQVKLPDGTVSFDLFGYPVRYILKHALHHIFPNSFEQHPTGRAFRLKAPLMVVEIDEGAASALLGEAGANGGRAERPPGNNMIVSGAGAFGHQLLGHLQANTIDSFNLQGFVSKPYLNGVYSAKAGIKVDNQTTFWHESEQMFIVSWNNGKEWYVAAAHLFNMLRSIDARTASDRDWDWEGIESKFEAHLSSCGEDETTTSVWWKPAGCEWVERFGSRFENPVRVIASPLVPFQVTKILVNKTAYENRIRTEVALRLGSRAPVACKFVTDLLAQLLSQAAGHRFYIDPAAHQQAVSTAMMLAVDLVPQDILGWEHELFSRESLDGGSRAAADEKVPALSIALAPIEGDVNGLPCRLQSAPIALPPLPLAPIALPRLDFNLLRMCCELPRTQAHSVQDDGSNNANLMDQACQQGCERVEMEQQDQVVVEGMICTEEVDASAVVEPVVSDTHMIPVEQSKKTNAVDISTLFPGRRFVEEGDSPEDHEEAVSKLREDATAPAGKASSSCGDGEEVSDSSNERSSDRSSGKSFRGGSDPRGSAPPSSGHCLAVLKDENTERKVFCEDGSQAVSKLREDAAPVGLGDRLLSEPIQKATLEEQMEMGAFLGQRFDRFLWWYNSLVARGYAASTSEAEQIRTENLGGGSRAAAEKERGNCLRFLRQLTGLGKQLESEEESKTEGIINFFHLV